MPGPAFVPASGFWEADTRVALGLMASRIYGDPSEELRLVGVTGTNGKTTIATRSQCEYPRTSCGEAASTRLSSESTHRGVVSTSCSSVIDDSFLIML